MDKLTKSHYDKGRGVKRHKFGKCKIIQKILQNVHLQILQSIAEKAIC